MAKKTTPTAGKAAAIDPDAQYRVTLAKPVRYAGQLLRPRNDLVLKGKVLAAIDGDAVTAYEPA